MNRLKKNVCTMLWATSKIIFIEARLLNIAKTTRNRTLGRVASIKSMIKRSLTTGQKRLRVEYSSKYMTMDMQTDLPLGFHSQMQVIWETVDYIMHGDDILQPSQIRLSSYSSIEFFRNEQYVSTNSFDQSFRYTKGTNDLSNYSTTKLKPYFRWTIITVQKPIL